MENFKSLEGVVTNIESVSLDNSGQSQCTLMMTLQTQSQGIVTFTVNANTYVLDCQTIHLGDYITAFYDTMAPVPLIYPPRYTALVLVRKTNGASQYVLDYFDYNLVNSSNTLKLNPSYNTKIVLPNGQMFLGSLPGKLLFVVYRFSTRSIPAITSPDQIIVFCS